MNMLFGHFLVYNYQILIFAFKKKIKQFLWFLQTFCRGSYFFHFAEWIGAVGVVVMLLWCDGCASMADSVRGRGAWLFHWPGYVTQHYTAHAAEGGGAAVGSAVPPGRAAPCAVAGAQRRLAFNVSLPDTGWAWTWGLWKGGWGGDY